MTRMQGVLEQVETYVARTVATEDASTADTVLFVGTILPLQTESGTCTVDINGTEYTATPTVADPPFITLDPPLVADVAADDLVTLVPGADVKLATVSFPGSDDLGAPLQYRVPYSLKAYRTLEDGPKNGTDRVSVIVETQPTPYVVDVPNEPALIKGEAIDPDSTVPPSALTDGLPPASSPVPTLEPFAVGALRWAVVPVANADPVRFKVYADTVDPPTQDAAHLVADSASLAGVFSTINGVALLPEDPTVAPSPIYVACVEYDADGEAAMSGTLTPAVPRRAGTAEIAVDWVYAGFIQAGQIEAGSIIAQMLGLGSFIALDGTDSSITIYADAEHTQPLIQLRPDGSVFRAQQVSVDDLAVLHSLRIQGTLSTLAQSGVLTLESSTGDPVSAPTVTLGLPQTAWPAVPAGWATRGITWDAAGSQWLRLLIKSPFVAGEEKVQRITWSGTEWEIDSEVTLNVPGTKEDSANGIVRIGASYYMAYLDASGSVTGWYLSKWSTAGVFQASIRIGPVTDYRPSVGTDGANVLVGRTDVDKVDVYDAGLAAQTASWSGSIPDGHSRFVGRGNFDFGANRILVQVEDTVYVYTLAGSALTEQVAERFTLIASASPGGMGWDGSNFFSSHGASALYQYNSHYPAANESAWVTYADTDTGSAKHTKDSPKGSVAIIARRYVQVALPPEPGGAATPRVYMALGNASPADTALLKRAEAVTNRSLRIDPSVAGGAALVRSATVTNKALTTNVATLTTSAAHGLEVGDTITVAGVDATFNGTYTISAVGSATTLSYAKTAGNVASTASGGTITNADSNTFGTGTPASIKTQGGGYELKGDGTESSPLLGHSDEKILSADASPTSTTNVAMASLNMSVTVKSTSDVVLVKLHATVLITTAGTFNSVELLVDGVADPKLLDTSISSGTGRNSGCKEWRLTGLAAGSHTIAFRTRNSAGSSGATIRATVTSAAYWTST